LKTKSAHFAALWLTIQLSHW